MSAILNPTVARDGACRTGARARAHVPIHTTLAYTTMILTAQSFSAHSDRGGCMTDISILQSERILQTHRPAGSQNPIDG